MRNIQSLFTLSPHSSVEPSATETAAMSSPLSSPSQQQSLGRSVKRSKGSPSSTYRSVNVSRNKGSPASASRSLNNSNPTTTNTTNNNNNNKNNSNADSGSFEQTLTSTSSTSDNLVLHDNRTELNHALRILTLSPHVTNIVHLPTSNAIISEVYSESKDCLADRHILENAETLKPEKLTTTSTLQRVITRNVNYGRSEDNGGSSNNMGLQIYVVQGTCTVHTTPLKFLNELFNFEGGRLHRADGCSNVILEAPGAGKDKMKYDSFVAHTKHSVTTYRRYMLVGKNMTSYALNSRKRLADLDSRRLAEITQDTFLVVWWDADQYNNSFFAPIPDIVNGNGNVNVNVGSSLSPRLIKATGYYSITPEKFRRCNVTMTSEVSIAVKVAIIAGRRMAILSSYNEVLRLAHTVFHRGMEIDAAVTRSFLESLDSAPSVTEYEAALISKSLEYLDDENEPINTNTNTKSSSSRSHGDRDRNRDREGGEYKYKRIPNSLATSPFVQQFEKKLKKSPHAHAHAHDSISISHSLALAGSSSPSSSSSSKESLFHKYILQVHASKETVFSHIWQWSSNSRLAAHIKRNGRNPRYAEHTPNSHSQYISSTTRYPSLAESRFFESWFVWDFVDDYQGRVGSKAIVLAFAPEDENPLRNLRYIPSAPKSPPPKGTVTGRIRGVYVFEDVADNVCTMTFVQSVNLNGGYFPKLGFGRGASDGRAQILQAEGLRSSLSTMDFFMRNGRKVDREVRLYFAEKLRTTQITLTKEQQKLHDEAMNTERLYKNTKARAVRLETGDPLVRMEVKQTSKRASAVFKNFALPIAGTGSVSAILDCSPEEVAAGLMIYCSNERTSHSLLDGHPARFVSRERGMFDQTHSAVKRMPYFLRDREFNVRSVLSKGMSQGEGQGGSGRSSNGNNLHSNSNEGSVSVSGSGSRGDSSSGGRKPRPMMIPSANTSESTTANTSVITFASLTCPDFVDFGLPSKKTVRALVSSIIKITLLPQPPFSTLQQSHVQVYRQIDAGGFVPKKGHTQNSHLTLNLLGMLREMFQQDEKVDLERRGALAEVMVRARVRTRVAAGAGAGGAGIVKVKAKKNVEYTEEYTEEEMECVARVEEELKGLKTKLPTPTRINTSTFKKSSSSSSSLNLNELYKISTQVNLHVHQPPKSPATFHGKAECTIDAPFNVLAAYAYQVDSRCRTCDVDCERKGTVESEVFVVDGNEHCQVWYQVVDFKVKGVKAREFHTRMIWRYYCGEGEGEGKDKDADKDKDTDKNKDNECDLDKAPSTTPNESIVISMESVPASSYANPSRVPNNGHVQARSVTSMLFTKLDTISSIPQTSVDLTFKIDLGSAPSCAYSSGSGGGGGGGALASVFSLDNSKVAANFHFLSKMREAFDQSVLVDAANRLLTLKRLSTCVAAYSAGDDEIIQRASDKIQSFKLNSAKKPVDVALATCHTHLAYSKGRYTLTCSSLTLVKAPAKEIVAYAWNRSGRMYDRVEQRRTIKVVEEKNGHSKVLYIYKEMAEKLRGYQLKGFKSLVRYTWKKVEGLGLGLGEEEKEEENENEKDGTGDAYIFAATPETLAGDDQASKAGSNRSTYSVASRLTQTKPDETRVEFVIESHFAAASDTFVSKKFAKFLSTTFTLRSLYRVNGLRVYFQELRKLEELDVEDGVAMGHAFIIAQKIGCGKKKKKEEEKKSSTSKSLSSLFADGKRKEKRLDFVRSRVHSTISSHTALSEFSARNEWFSYTMTGILLNDVDSHLDITSTDLSNLRHSEAMTLGRRFTLDISTSPSPHAAVGDWIDEFKPMKAFDEVGKNAWFRAMLNVLAVELLKRSSSASLGWNDSNGAVNYKAVFAAFLSVASKAASGYTVFEVMKKAETEMYANLIIACLLLNFALQLLLVFVKCIEQPVTFKTLLHELAMALLCLKLDAGRGKTRHLAFDQLTQCSYAKAIEVAVESLPCGLIQVYVLEEYGFILPIAVSCTLAAQNIAHFSATLSFEQDTSLLNRKMSPDFYGFVKTESPLERNLTFLALFLLSYVHVTMKFVSFGLITSIETFGVGYIAVYLSIDMLVYLVYRAVRGDLRFFAKHLGSSSSSNSGSDRTPTPLILSLLVRISVKFVTDMTGCVHSRSPLHLGGLYWCLSFLSTGPLTSLLATTTYDRYHANASTSIEPDPFTFGSDSGTHINSLVMWTACLLIMFIWTLSCLSLWLLIDQRYYHTFYSSLSGCQYVHKIFLCGKTAAEKMRVFDVHESYFRSICVEIRMYIDENIDGWEAEKPEWWTLECKAMIPDECLPGRFLEGFGREERVERKVWGKGKGKGEKRGAVVPVTLSGIPEKSVDESIF